MRPSRGKNPTLGFLRPSERIAPLFARLGSLGESELGRTREGGLPRPWRDGSAGVPRPWRGRPSAGTGGSRPARGGGRHPHGSDSPHGYKGERTYPPEGGERRPPHGPPSRGGGPLRGSSRVHENSVDPVKYSSI